jgi:hypothetical protein
MAAPVAPKICLVWGLVLAKEIVNMKRKTPARLRMDVLTAESKPKI